jgi:hypothetical protein
VYVQCHLQTQKRPQSKQISFADPWCVKKSRLRGLGLDQLLGADLQERCLCIFSNVNSILTFAPKYCRRTPAIGR